MLSLRCCKHTCSEVRVENHLYFLHSGTWDCERREVDDEDFYERFRHLPWEMRLHVLSFCQFHVLANTELWLREEDPPFLPRLLERDPHFSTRRCASCLPMCHLPNAGRRPTFDFARDRFRMNVRLYVHHSRNRSPVSARGFHVLHLPTPLPSGPVKLVDLLRPPAHPTREDCNYLSGAFGRNNRFTCCYYRRCRHHDLSRPSQEKTCESERWRLLARSTGVKLSATGKSFLQSLKPPSTPFHREGYQWLWTMYDSREPPPQREWYVSMEPGTYYFEFVDHTWENMVAAIDGRTRHFLVDPVDEMQGEQGQYRGWICMSLDFRCILHPTDEASDTFETIIRFDQSSDELERGLVFEDACKVLVIPVTAEGGDCVADEELCDRDDLIQKMEMQMVYNHNLSPRLGFSICRWAIETEDSCPKRQGFKVTFRGQVRLFSMEKKKGCFRVNFFINVRDLSWAERTLYGDAMRRLVKDDGSSFYAFMCPTTPDVEDQADAIKVFETFLH